MAVRYFVCICVYFQCLIRQSLVMNHHRFFSLLGNARLVCCVYQTSWWYNFVPLLLSKLMMHLPNQNNKRCIKKLQSQEQKNTLVTSLYHTPLVNARNCRISIILSKEPMQHYYILQWPAIYCPRAGSSLPRHFTRPATFYCYPADDLFFFFSDRFAAMNRRNDPHLLAKTFFLVVAIDST